MLCKSKGTVFSMLPELYNLRFSLRRSHNMVISLGLYVVQNKIKTNDIVLLGHNHVSLFSYMSSSHSAHHILLRSSTTSSIMGYTMSFKSPSKALVK